MPPVTKRLVVLLFAVFSALALLMATALPPDGSGFVVRLSHFLPFYWVWGLLSVAVVTATRYMRLHGVNVSLQVPLHIALAISVSAVHLALYVSMMEPFQVRFGNEPLSYYISAAFDRHFVSNLITYAATALATLAFDHYRLTREALAEARLDTMRMQLQPHFLFNTLQVTSSLMHRDIDAAEEMIERLGDFLRHVLKRDDRHLVSVAEELELLDHYLAIMRLRFGERLQVSIDVDKRLLTTAVPVLLLQPLAENALQHGLAGTEGRGNLRIGIVERDGQMVLSVEDDGTGISHDAVPQERVGLTNTRARIAELFGKRASMRITAAESGGARIELVLPIVSPEEAHQRAPSSSTHASRSRAQFAASRARPPLPGAHP